MGLSAAPAWAQVSGQIAVTSDYRWRGVSLTDGGPALQSSLSYDHSSGLFAGLFASNVELRPGDGGLGVQAFGGYARRWRDDSAWDVGVVGYVYPRTDQGTTYNYLEAFAGATVDQFGVRLYISDSYYGSGNRSAYIEGSYTVPLTGWLALGVHVGVLQQWTTGSSRYARVDETRVDGRIGVTAEAAGFTFELSVVAAQTQDCPGGPALCEPGVVATVSRGF
jgi:uncharacterized protein (TIGR02001 family)